MSTPLSVPAAGSRRAACLLSRVPGLSRHAATPSQARSWTSGLRTGLVVGGSVAGLGVGAVAAVAGFYARMVVTPPKQGSSEVLPVLGVGFETPDPGEGELPQTVTLPATTETLAPGRYELVFDGGRGSATIGQIISYSPKLQTVVRTVEQVRAGDLATARRGRWSGSVYLDPAEAGFDFTEVTLDLPVGPAPAWVVPAPADSDCTTWGIMVHGRGAARQETLRALATTQELGMNTVHLAYRNDLEAPPSEDGRYGLGFTEWEDVDVAIAYALAQGASDVVLFGWSMGGAIALQTADRSRHRRSIRALVLDAPVVDWFELIRFHSRQYRMPLRLGQLVADLLGEPRAGLMTGLGSPIRLADLDWLSRSEELRTPTLILHSLDDEFVPASASVELASRNPSVRLVPFEKAQHTKEWNVDPRRWEETVREWLRPYLAHGPSDA